jgi:hypothetical protein
MDPMIEAAKRRARVRVLPAGKLGALTYWPMHADQRSSGRRHARARAVIRLDTGSYVNAAPDEVELLTAQEAR